MRESLSSDGIHADYQRFLELTAELTESLAGKQGYLCGAAIEEWELKYRQDALLGPFVINHANATRQTLLKHPGGDIVNVSGDHNTIQTGDGNFSNVSGNAASGGSSIRQSPPDPPTEERPNSGASANAPTGWISVIISSVAALFAVWWLLPPGLSGSFPSVRTVVSIAALVFVIVWSVISYISHRRRVWEKVTLFSLGATMLVRSFASVLVGQFEAGAGEATDAGIPAWVVKAQWFVGSPQSDLVDVVSIVAGVVILVLAFRVGR